MSNHYLKAKNKKTGEIEVFTAIDNSSSYDYLSEDLYTHYSSKEFHDLYDIIHQTDLGVNDDTSKKDDILDETWRVRLNNSMINLEKYISITDFIGDFFQQELDRICEEVKSKEKCQLDHDENPEYSKGYDQAIDDIITLIS